MTRSRVSLLAVVGVAAWVMVSGGAAAHLVAAPPGLTGHGRLVWNLDALLHDTFGSRAVYLNARQNYPRSPRNFSPVGGADCCSSYYLYTFRNARSSAFNTTRPTKPPKPEIGAAGYEVPLTIKGSYIYCGSGKWLFEHGGNGPANWQITCHT